MARKKVEKEEVKEETVNIEKVKKELNKYLEEQKENITQEINNKIDEKLEFKINKRMKEEEKRYVRNKNKKIIIRDIIIILLLAIIGYFGYCLYDIDYFNIRTKVVEKPVSKEENNKPVESEPDKPDPVADVHDSGYYIENYSYLLDNIFIEDESVYNLFNTNITKDNISNELKLKIAYKNLHKNGITIEKDMLTFKSSELQETAKKIFGENTTLNNEMFSYNNIKFMFYNDTYLGINEEEKEVGLLTKITNAKEENDTITFDIIVAKLTDENKLVNDKNEVILETYQDEDLLSLQDKLSTYSIFFNKENDNYIFDSIKQK